MGTNYYLHMDVCKNCGVANTTIHIGKASAGWRFGLDVSKNNTEYFSDFYDFEELITTHENIIIKDEYGREISPEDLLVEINNHRVDKQHQDCYKDGPVDLIKYEFE